MVQRDVYDILLSRLKGTNLIEYFDVQSTTTPVDIATATKLAKYPVQIFIEDGVLCYKNENEETVECPNFDTNVSDAGYWLSDKIPDPTFDVLQGGNLRKAEEAESCYICCIIAAILKDEVFTSELEVLFKSYDFERMIGNDDTQAFSNLLREWMDLQSIIINVIVSASKYSISNRKKDYEQFLQSGLEDQELDALRDLALDIKSVNFKYSTGVLSPQNVKNLSKIEILQFIDERNAIINSKIDSNKFGKLYKTMKLSSEYVSPITKKKISNWVVSSVDSLYNENPGFKDTFGERTVVMSKFRIRAYKLATRDVIKKNVLKYLANRDAYDLPRKL